MAPPVVLFFSTKKCITFLISHQNVYCGYLLEAQMYVRKMVYV